jgi:small Trp-rich protein
MWFVVIGVVLLLMKVAGFGPVADWGWVWVLLPFGLALVWWAVADATGYTQRRAIDKMEERKLARRQRDMEALGLDTRRDKQLGAARRRAKGRAPPPAAREGREPPR